MSIFDAMYGMQNAQSTYDTYLKEQMWNQRNAYQGIGLGSQFDQIAPPPVTNPEPNPVLLLLE